MNKYVERFFSQNSACDLLPVYGNYKNTKVRDKEISESFGILEAALSYAKLDRKANIKAYIVGDGKYPRTSSLLAFHTSWSISGIDPEYNMDWIAAWFSFKEAEGRPINRLSFLNNKVESYKFTNAEQADKYLIVLPHSHATMAATLKKFSEIYGCQQTFTVINMPCCVQLHPKLCGKKAIDFHSYQCYKDEDILSIKNTIHIWENMNFNGYTHLTGKYT